MDDSPSHKDNPEYFARTADSAHPDPGSGKPDQKPSTNAQVAATADWKDGVGPLHADARKDEEEEAGDTQAKDDGDGQVKSRSADPGQSSYGGFKDEGGPPSH